MLPTLAGHQAGPGADELERRLGDPWDPANPLGFDRVLTADEREEMFGDGERALDDYGLNAEFVPAELGGRLTRMDRMVDVMRAVYRRDPCLGLGYGASSFIAAVNVWTAGDAVQQLTTADLLLANRKVACAYHELAHGNDMAGTELAARAGGDRLLLHGRKEVVTNIERAEAVVLFARTDPEPGSRSHSLLFLEKAALPADRYHYLPRFRSVGMRGVQLGGMEFRDCSVDPSSLLGSPGRGLETAVRAFQLTRTALPAMMTGLLDTGLRVTLRHVLNRRLYGRAAAELPYLRSVLVGAFADLLMCEAMAQAGLRALHLLPEQTSVYAPAVKYALAKPLLEAMQQLAGVLGAQFYLCDGPHAIFQKLVRDMKPVAFGHIARAVCQATILPQLPLLARRSWRDGEPAPDALFRPDATLPPLDFQRLRVSAGGRDHLAPSLAAGLAALGPSTDPQVRAVARLAAGFAAELRALSGECAELAPHRLAFPAGVAANDLPIRYVRVLVATACFELWRHHHVAGTGFLAEPAWALAVLSRLAATDGSVPDLPPAVEQRMFAELLDRYEARRSFGLADRSRPAAG